MRGCDDAPPGPFWRSSGSSHAPPACADAASLDWESVLVCQCWDDGFTDDGALTALLRSLAVPATFNLNPGLHQDQRYVAFEYTSPAGGQPKPVWRLAREELDEVYRDFRIGNHTLTHPDLTGMTPEAVAEEVGQGRRILQEWFDQDVRGFAYPFGRHDQTARAAVAAAGHSYGRTVESTDDVLGWPDRISQAASCHFRAADFWQRYEQARQREAAFYFWGHSYELVSRSDWTDLAATYERICADDRAVWCEVSDVLG